MGSGYACLRSVNREYASRVPTCLLDVYRRESGGLPRGTGKSDGRTRFRTSDAVGNEMSTSQTPDRRAQIFLPKRLRWRD